MLPSVFVKVAAELCPSIKIGEEYKLDWKIAGREKDKVSCFIDNSDNKKDAVEITKAIAEKLGLSPTFVYATTSFDSRSNKQGLEFIITPESVDYVSEPIRKASERFAQSSILTSLFTCSCSTSGSKSQIKPKGGYSQILKL